MNILIIIIYIVYFLAPYQLFALGNYGVTAGDIAIGIFILLFLKRMFWNGERLTFSSHKGTLMLVGLAAAAIISGITPLLISSKPMILQYLKSSIHLFFFLAFPLICSIYPIKSKTWERVVKTWLIIGFFINIFGVYQIIARAYDLPFAWLSYTNISLTSRNVTTIEEFSQLSLQYGDFFRATSIFTEPSSLAAFNIFMIVYLIIPFIHNQKPFIKSKVINALFFIACFVATFLTFSMTAFIGVILVVGSIFIFERTKQVKSLLKILSIAAIIIVATDYIVASYSDTSVLSLFRQRIEGIIHFGSGKKATTYGETLGVRLNSAYKSIDIWEEYPINGIGIGLSGYSKKVDLKFSDFSIFAALAEMGLIGFLVFLGLFATLFAITLNYIIKKRILYDLKSENQRLAGILYYLMLIQFMINYLTGNNLVNIGLWIPMAMIFGVINIVNLERNINVKEISFVKKPIKQTFLQLIEKSVEKSTDKN